MLLIELEIYQFPFNKKYSILFLNCRKTLFYKVFLQLVTIITHSPAGVAAHPNPKTLAGVKKGLKNNIVFIQTINIKTISIKLSILELSVLKLSV